MNDLFLAMARDMNIDKCNKESDLEYSRRICYSALGQWCLCIAENQSIDGIGSTKHNLTITMNNLISNFSKLIPDFSEWIAPPRDTSDSLSVFIRRTYEETGYLFINENNMNTVANYGRTIQLGNGYLYFGTANVSSVNGLGQYVCLANNTTNINDFLLRDSLNCEEFINARYNSLDYYELDISLEDLEFFNPLSKNVPSQSWEKTIRTPFSIARKAELGPYYYIIHKDGSTLFMEEYEQLRPNSFTGYEMRRMLFSLKAYYQSPLPATIETVDDNYSILSLKGHLPNREYFFMLLVSWPLRNPFDKTKFMFRNELKNDIVNVLQNIGISINGG